MSGIKLFEFEAHVDPFGFAANIYGSHCKNITWIFKATWVKRGLEINCQMLPQNFVLLSVTNKTKKFEHSLEIEKRHKPATINY